VSRQEINPTASGSFAGASAAVQSSQSGETRPSASGSGSLQSQFKLSPEFLKLRDQYIAYLPSNLSAHEISAIEPVSIHEGDASMSLIGPPDGWPRPGTVLMATEKRLGLWNPSNGDIATHFAGGLVVLNEGRLAKKFSMEPGSKLWIGGITGQQDDASGYTVTGKWGASMPPRLQQPGPKGNSCATCGSVS
jgi:hypothetical protein